MLYNNGEQLNTPYIAGDKLFTIYQNGKYMYPATPGAEIDYAVLDNDQGAILNNCTSIVSSAEPPPSGTNYKDITRTYNRVEYTDTIAIGYNLNNLQYYDSTKIYSVGDVVLTWRTTCNNISFNTMVRTCVINMTEPEIYTPEHWCTGCYPNVLGLYDATRTYQVGDTVFNNSSVYTCISNINTPEAWKSSHWRNDYNPGITIYSAVTEYHVGDTVLGQRNPSSALSPFTCVKSNIGESILDTEYWCQDYCPGLCEYTESATYRLGDVVWYSGNMYTYINRMPTYGVPVTRLDYWRKGYAPGITDAMFIDNRDYYFYPYYVGSKIIRLELFNNANIDSVNVVTYPTHPCLRLNGYQFEKYHVYTWASGATQYIYSDAPQIKADSRLPSFTDNSHTVTDISALAKWDTHLTYSLNGLLHSYNALSDLSPLAEWDVSNVRYMTQTFFFCHAITSLQALKKWKLYSLIYLNGTFTECIALTTLDGLEEWHASNINSIGQAFFRCTALEDISALASWDMYKLCDASSAFRGCSSLTDISALANWHTPHLTNMAYMLYNTAIDSLSPLANWDTSKVTTMAYAFYGCSNITEISNLHWDVSRVADWENTFYNLTGVTEIRELYFTGVNVVFNFEGATSLVKADLSRCSLKSGLTGISMGSDLFRECPNLEVCDVGTIYNSSTMRIWGSSGGPFTYCTKLRIVIFRNTARVFGRAYYYGYGDGLDNLARNNGKIYVPQSMLQAYLNSADYAPLLNAGIEILPLEGSPYEQPGSL